MMGTVHEDQCTFLIISHPLLRMKNVSDKSYGENKNTHLMLNNFFFCGVGGNAIYEIMWTNSVELGRPQMTIWCMPLACWIPKATNTHSQYVILLACLQQQWLHEHTSVLCLAYVACYDPLLYYAGPFSCYTVH
jgi:hypothetical protein